MEYSLITVAAIGAISSIIVSLLNRKKIEQTGEKIDSLHLLINSNLSRQIAASIAEALERGIAIGIEQERIRGETRTGGT